MKVPAVAAACTALCSGVILAGVPGAVAARQNPVSGRCTAAATKTVVHEFVGAFNTGRLAKINSLWAPAPRFQWYSTLAPGRRLGPPAYDRATLIPYLRTRVRVHERLLLTELGAGYDRRRNIVHFGGKLVRDADDMQRPRHLDFKGAADCVSGRPLLIVWSM